MYTNIAFGEGKNAIDIDTSQAVIYCDVSLGLENSLLEIALKEGSQMTYHWDVVIEEVRNYWLNKDIGQVAFRRQVIPDLVSRQWLLKDSNSGITGTTFSTVRAIRFLTHLKNFPVIDKSLLQQGSVYKLRIKLYIEEGEISDSWWGQALKLGKTVAVESFSLP
ncbi:MAG: DUF4390 domain-containing protein [Mariprofundaceae bacterium]|nr:DUF4390 domain-containing protein [Mariprofundaceae bacterium]